MTPEIRRAALRAAAKAALIVSLGPLGCAGGSKSPPSNTPATSTTPEAAQPASCADYLDGLAVTKGELPADDPLHGRMDVYGAFSDVAARSAPRTQACCQEALAAGAQAAHRWECCSALGEAADAMACTPWGPPCPPAMA